MTTELNGQSLAILISKSGFSCCLQSKNKFSPIIEFKINDINSKSGETELDYELRSNQLFKQRYQNVYLGFMSEVLNVVPNQFIEEPYKKFLNFGEENNLGFSILETPLVTKEISIIYGIYSSLKDILLAIPFFEEAIIVHSGKLLIDLVEKEETSDEIFINLNYQLLEVLIYKKGELQFYNTFEISNQEDLLFYILFTFEQLEIDPNKVNVKCFGGIAPKSKYYQTLKKYIRNLSVGTKDLNFAENFSLYKLFECE